MATATRVVDQTPTGDEAGETYATRPDRAGPISASEPTPAAGSTAPQARHDARRASTP